MSAGTTAYATMITNFDSTEQRTLWESTWRKAGEGRNCEDLRWNRLWFRNRNTRVDERMLNDHPEFATTFAGIIRTAYLYCPKIMLTDAQLFDGVFFLALGPRAVNGIVGRSYKDGPAIVVSGRCETLEECLFDFTVKTIGEVRPAIADSQNTRHRQNRGAKADDGRSRADCTCADCTCTDCMCADHSCTGCLCAECGKQYTLRPLEYSAVGGVNLTADDVLALDAREYRKFTCELQRARGCRSGEYGGEECDGEECCSEECGSRGQHEHDMGGVASAIARMMARVLKHKREPGWEDADIENQCRFLGERWQEWIDAEREGLVLYENQNDAAIKERAHSRGFQHYFRQYGVAYAADVLERCGMPQGVVDICRQEQQRLKSSEASDDSTRLANDFRNRLLGSLRESDEAGLAATESDETTERRRVFTETLLNMLDAPQRSKAFRILKRDMPPVGAEHAANAADIVGVKGVKGVRDVKGVEGATGTTPSITGKDGSTVIRYGVFAGEYLRDWYQLVYQKALARHLGAQLVAVDAAMNSVEQVAGSSRRGASLMLSGKITKLLGGMPYIRFATFCYETRGVIDRWRACTGDDADDDGKPTGIAARCRRWLLHDVLRMDPAQRITRSVAYAVQQASEERDLAGDAKSLLYTGGVAAVLAFISAMADNVWFDSSTPVWILVLLAWAVGIVPNLLDGIGWLRGVHDSSASVVYMG